MLDESVEEVARQQKMITVLKKEILEIRERSKQSAIESEQMMKCSKALLNFVETSELYRKKFSEKLREALSNSDQ